MPKIPSISSKKFCKFLLDFGCEFVRTDGDHDIFWKTGLLRPVVVPIRKHLPIFIILNNIKTMGISREEFLKRLENI